MATTQAFDPRSGAWNHQPDAAAEDDDRFDDVADEIEDRIAYHPNLDLLLTAITLYSLYCAMTTHQSLLVSLRTGVLAAVLLFWITTTVHYHGLDAATRLGRRLTQSTFVKAHSDHQHHILLRRAIHAHIVAGIPGLPAPWTWTNVALIVTAWLVMLRQFTRILHPFPSSNTIRTL
jgi:hypothetical protein